MFRKRHKIFAVCVCVVLFVYFVNATVEKQVLQTNQEGAIRFLAVLSCRYHGYKTVDASGNYFGYGSIEQFTFIDIFRYPAMLAAPKTVIHSRSYSRAYIFPISAKNDPLFRSVLEDMQNPRLLVDAVGQSHTIQGGAKLEIRAVKEYFSRHLDSNYRLEIWFVDDDALTHILTTRKAPVIDKIVVVVPVNSTIVGNWWR